MTESEWLTGNDPVALMCGLQGFNISYRKQQLFNCAVARAVCHTWPDPVCEKHIELVERQLDQHPVEEAECDRVKDEVGELARTSNILAQEAFEESGQWTPSALAQLRRSIGITTTDMALGSMEWWFWVSDLEYTSTLSAFDAGWVSMLIDNYRACLPLLRCIVGNPFRPVTFADSWRSETAVALATGIYTERAFDRLPILADALEEAGCDHPDVLAHCRNPGIHARGCWVVDGVLGNR